MIGLTDDKNYQNIADAIREKNGSSDTYKPSEMANAIRGIEGGGGVNFSDIGYTSEDVGQIKEMIDYSKQLQVESNVHFLGRKTPEEVMSILADADIYVQPSITEGLPRAVVEAMSTGLPCIGFNTGGIPELLEPEYIARLKDVNGIVQRIKILEDVEIY